ncbi:Lrp/AsnC family transcriptional regulator [Sinorhizobium numidicum]|uniref:Lrp/AsnC family transcriptional regulator n=1 Tax=Sinorhizobium numidicum TaxID=680248 RepID=A0ABY8CQF5_9HYPH|nr:Lrp/AsnC family transcriptional regulator [Sinorhizobium numidicum]WEX74901.1 Lrp/AsnC family transcriptional regulator [Sinorhizobium numidicum]WEX80894.1 Lrp/AsnC family transcriptional regulator [Sinorhizobium numidicum]
MDYGDSIDRNLISMLEENARLPASELARRVGLARSSVQERIERLERRGIILGYRAIVGRHLVAQSIFAYLFIATAPRAAQRLFAILREYPEILAADATSGPANIMCRVCVNFLEDLDALIEDLAKMEGIESVTSSVVLSNKINRESGLINVRAQ